MHRYFKKFSSSYLHFSQDVVNTLHLYNLTRGRNDVEYEVFARFFKGAERALDEMQGSGEVLHISQWRRSMQQLRKTAASIGAVRMIVLCSTPVYKIVNKIARKEFLKKLKHELASIKNLFVKLQSPS